MWWKKRDKTPHLLEVIPREVQQATDEWMKEIGVSKLYSKFEPFEDPMLVEGAPLIPTQEKMEIITLAQKASQKSINKNRLIIDTYKDDDQEKKRKKIINRYN